MRRYLDLLTGVFMLRQLPPWFENLGKRQVKATKVFVRDSGLLHALLGMADQRSLELTPKSAHSWEGFAIEEVLKALGPTKPIIGPRTREPNSICYYSRMAAGSESNANAWTHQP